MRNQNSQKKHPGLVGGTIIAASLVFLTVAALLIVNNGVLATMTSFLSEPFQKNGQETSETGTTQTEGPSSQPEEDLPPGDIVFARPDLMKGVWLNAGTDYLFNENDSGEIVKAQIGAAFDKLADWGFNTVMIPLSADGGMRYGTSGTEQVLLIRNADGSEFDAPEYILKCARERGVFTYGVLDLRVNTGEGFDPGTQKGAQAIHDMAVKASKRYSFDGWMLENPGYAKGSGGSYAEYMQTMPGGGFERFQRDSITAAVKDAVETIKSANANFYVGLLAGAVWANAAEEKDGSQTSGAYAEYSDGFADTRAWVGDGLFDFVMVKNGNALSSGSAPFEKVLEWWGGVCRQSGKPLYVAHDSTRVCGNEQGWKSPDQLAQQVIACKKSAEWQGSAFTSLAALAKDKTGSTQALLDTFGGTLNEQYISRKLIFTAPTKKTLTTNESKINIRGSADPNFPLTMNGKKVALSAHGFFSIDLTLTVGVNKFTFSHKGDTVTYNITYRVVVIQKVQPASSLTLEGGTTISITAIAYKGSNLYAKLGNTTIRMKQSAIQTDESDSGGEGSDYINFAGEYTLPKGIREKTQNLGTLMFHGSYKTLRETKKGGTLTVKAIPAPPTTTTTKTTTSASQTDQSGATGTTGSTRVDPIDPGGTGGAVLATGKIMMISKDYAETLSGSTSDDWSRPVNAYLPYGTMDTWVKDVYDSATKSYYYLLGSGRRVYQSNAAVYKTSGNLTANRLTAGAVAVDAATTDISLNSLWHVPYNFRLLPQKYGNEATQNYNITAFTATYVELTFYYTTSASGTFDLSGSTLFKSAEWIKGSGNTCLLRLNLRNTGVFYGYSVKWDNDGNLTFSFKNPTGTASGSKPLTGKRIVIDPGHGGNSIGAGGGTTCEKIEVLKYGLVLRDKLTALGATVIMTRTADINPDKALNPASMAARTAHARDGKADLFISVHMDGSNNSSAHGYTVFYFNEYSWPYAKAVAARAETTYKSFTKTAGRGVKWAPFFVTRVHDVPAILVECGYMSNTTDLELLISKDYRNAFTQAMADGIVDYFKASPVSVKTEGSTSAAETKATAAAAALIAPAGMIALARRRKKAVITCMS